jgi:hypothetical protein
VFWKRWHISLSSWIRDYLYLPLIRTAVHDRSTGGLIQAVDERQKNKALFSAWAIMGLWHGANWTFVIWGLYHALAIYVYRLIAPIGRRLSNTTQILLGICITLPVMMLGWIPFRAENLEVTIDMYLKVLDPRAYMWLGLRENTYIIAVILVLGSGFTYLVYNRFRVFAAHRIAYSLLAELALFTAILPLIYIFLRPISQFIYFQF